MAVIMSRFMTVPERVNYAEWIESTGQQYFKTGVYHNADTCPGLRMVIDAEILTTTGAGLNGIGSYQSFYVGQMSGYLYYSPYYGDVNTNVAYSTTKRYVYDLDNASKKFTVKTADGSTVYSANTTVGTPSGSREIYLFAFNSSDAGSVGEYTKQKLYSAKFYLNGEFIQDLWPCYDPDGVACLYDKVEKKYYYNSGSGEFIGGGSDAGGEEPDETTITFTLNGTTYTAEQGMTWAQFVNSSYNTDGFYLFGMLNTVAYTKNGTATALNYNNKNVYSTDVIIANGIYT